MSLRDRAKALSNITDIMNGREKVNIDEVIATYSEGIEVIDFDILTDRKTNDEYVVLVIAEEPKSFFFGGLAITNFFKELSGEDKEGTRKEVQAEHLKMKLSQKRSQNGRIYTAYEVL